MMDFLNSPSSRAAKGGIASDRLEEPEVETVESDDDEACVGWPDRGGFADWTCWCWVDADLVSWRNCGVLEKAYGATGAWVPR